METAERRSNLGDLHAGLTSEQRVNAADRGQRCSEAPERLPVPFQTQFYFSAVPDELELAKRVDDPTTQLHLAQLEHAPELGNDHH